MTSGGTMRDFVMPKLGLTMKQGKVTRWYVKPGQSFRRGQRLVQVTTEKVSVDVDAAYDGTLVEILVPESGKAPVGAPIARVETAEAGAALETGVGVGGEAAGSGSEAASRKPQVAAQVVSASYPPRPPAPKAPAPAGGSGPAPAPAGGPVRATPAAKRLARELGVDLGLVSGSGPEGRVVEEDVRAAAAGAAPAAGPAAPSAGSAAPAGVSRPHSEWRAAVARNMAESSRTVAPVTLHRTVVFDKAKALLSHPVLAEAKAGPLDLVVKAVAEALRAHPDLNATFTDEALVIHTAVNVGVAIALPEGLLVPVLRGADRLSLPELARSRRALWDRARGGSLLPDDITGGTFTVSNLGPFGVEGFTPIINLPEVGILGVGRSEERPVAEGGRMVVRTVLPLSLTFDHRAVDGAPAAVFLDAVASRLAEPPPGWAPRTPRLPEGEDTFDVAIIGSGPAGFSAAVTAAGFGARVALVESADVGGVCLNKGCVPTKTAIERLRAVASVRASLAGLREAAGQVVARVRQGTEDRLADLGVAIVRGEPRLGWPAAGTASAVPAAAPVVEVGGRRLTASAVILATGSEPIPFALPPALDPLVRAGRVIAVEDLLSGGAALAPRAGAAGPGEPKRALVVGGGPGGIEAAIILAGCGAKVTLVEKLATLLPGEEEDVGALIRGGLEKKGVDVRVATDVSDFDPSGGPETAGQDAPGLAPPFDLVVLAVGRGARVGRLGLGVDLLDERGFVRVDDWLRTGAPGLYAAGDVAGPPFWAHRAMEEGRVAAANALATLEGFPDATTRRRPALDLVPRVVFSEPEFAGVGLTAAKAAAAGLKTVTGTCPMVASPRARAAGAAEGFVRVVGDRASGKLLGLEAVCPHATELAGAAVIALLAGLDLRDLATSPFPHPTFSEAVGDAARDALAQGSPQGTRFPYGGG